MIRQPLLAAHHNASERTIPEKNTNRGNATGACGIGLKPQRRSKVCRKRDRGEIRSVYRQTVRRFTTIVVRPPHRQPQAPLSRPQGVTAHACPAPPAGGKTTARAWNEGRSRCAVLPRRHSNVMADAGRRARAQSTLRKEGKTNYPLTRWQKGAKGLACGHKWGLPRTGAQTVVPAAWTRRTPHKVKQAAGCDSQQREG